MCSILSPVPPLVSVVGSPTVVPKYALAFIFITLPPKFKAELELPIVKGKYVSLVEMQSINPELGCNINLIKGLVAF